MNPTDQTSSIYLSIVIPIYNRKLVVERAIRSCLDQSYQNFEVIIVDDCSTDDPEETIKQFNSNKLIYLRKDTNHGVSGARRYGSKLARGQWILYLDSDDEYVPGAFQRIYEETQKISDDIMRIAFRYQRDDGLLLPSPFVDKQILDYKQYFNWLEQSVYSDVHNCVRSSTIEKVNWEEQRFSEMLYSAEFSKNYLTYMHSEVVAIIHSDASNRLSVYETGRAVQQLIMDSRFKADVFARYITENGTLLKQLSPRKYHNYLIHRSINYFLSRQRSKGIRSIAPYILSRPFSIYGWVILIIGNMNAKWLATMIEKRKENHRMGRTVL
jgi:glycosyltransferase involved in cell wall biosynthesis